MTTNREYGICQRTPAVSVLDNRGRTVREIQYHRHPDTPEITDERITRHHYGILGFLSESTDPRLYAQRQKDPSVGHNFTYLTSLSGAVLRIESADAGTSLTLNDVAGRPHLMVSATGVLATWQYENEELSGRPLCMIEQDATGTSRITERFLYAGNTQGEKDRNLCGLCVHHYETAGLVQTDSVSLTGRPLAVTRQLLKETAGTANWQGEDASAWNDLLTPERYTTLMTVDASGAVLTTTDAAGNLQRVAYDVAGVLNSSWLTVKDGQEQIIVKALAYSAAGQKLREEHHNGLVTTYRYAPETQQLTEIITERPAGHPAGARVLQHHSYEYDPVGNVVRCTDNAEETRFWRNQKVLAENTYVYDSLYQLISSTGREMAGIAAQGVMLPSAIIPLPTDSNAFTPYTRTYRYDVGGNLTQIRHSAPASGNRYTTEITVSDRNNRAVLNTLAASPDQVDALFSAGGQQGQLAPGQHLTWTSRGELGGITPVQRDGQPADSETYRYDAGSQRIIKISTQKTANSSQAQRTLYLPGLEIRTTTNGNNETEILHTLIIANARMLHWVAGKNTSDQIRYSYGNLTGNSGLEVDGEGKVISLEEYYPFGGTAVWTARSRAEADWKTIRYSGKERDATGLYYYGYRYYQPWAGRWLSADPAGTEDGINLYRMVRNNPVTLWDAEGLAPPAYRGVNDMIERQVTEDGLTIIHRGRSEIPTADLEHFDAALKLGISVLEGAIQELTNIQAGDAVTGRLSNHLISKTKKTIKGFVPALLKQLSQIKEGISRYVAGGEKSNQIAQTESEDPTEIARIVNDDQDAQRIFLSRKAFNSSETEFAHTLIHEASHLFSDTVDIWYNNSLFKEGGDFMKISDSISRTAEIEHSIISGNNASHYLTEDVKALYGETRLNEIFTKMNNNPGYGNKIILSNADSLTNIAFSIGRERIESHMAGKKATLLASLATQARRQGRIFI